MGLFSVAKLFGLTIRESADDGSDFTNPDADYRRIFLGEDGHLHAKDSAGTVTDLSSAPFTNLDIPTSTTPSQTAEGRAVWDSDDDKLTIGTGAARKTLVNEGAITSSGLTQATARLLGRTTSSTGAVEEISVGTGLSLSAGSLTATGSAGATHTTLGYDTIGGSSGATTANLIYLKKVTVATAGVITGIGAYIKQNTGGATVTMAGGLWGDNAGAPEFNLGGSYITIFGQITSGTPGSARWVTVPLGLYVTAGDYWIGFQLSNASWDVYSDGSGSDRTVAPNSTPQLADYGGNIYTLTTTSNKYSLRAHLVS